MQQLTFIKPGKLEWWDVSEPKLENNSDALVRPIAVARCDLDTGILQGIAPFRGELLHFLRNHLPESIGQKKLFRNAPFKGCFPIGHEFVAEVVSVGDNVKGFSVGNRVIVPFQISCGDCDFCRRGLTNSCTAVPPRSMYGLGDIGGKGWGGAFSDLVRVPFAEKMLVTLPDGVKPEIFASADNIPDGFRTVAPHLANRPNAEVLVVGGEARSIGLYSVATAVAMGASVDYVDSDRKRLEIATSLGATAIEATKYERTKSYQITVDASADPKGLAFALKSTEAGGVCTSVGIYYTPTTPIPLLAMYGTGVTFITGRVNARACLPEVISLYEHGTFQPEKVTTLLAGWNDAPEALLDNSTKVVIRR